MRFEEVLSRYRSGRLSSDEAADVLGMSVSSFYRWRCRYEGDGETGLQDRRIGKTSPRRAPVDEVAKVLELFETRYFDFSVKHFHETGSRHRTGENTRRHYQPNTAMA
ncbi:helix-turn-helix domain-containing protein, partial [Azospirillum oleiclasticum]